MTYNLEESRWRVAHRPFTASAHYLISVFYNFTQETIITTEDYIDLIGIKTQHEEFKKQLALQKARIATFESLSLENEKLRTALGLIQDSPYKLELAEVLSFDALPDMRSVIINKGSDHGIEKEMGLLSESGNVVGYIIQTLSKTSTALLITDRYAVVDAMTQRSRFRGLLEGRSAYSLRLKNFRRADDVLKGDLIVTSPFGRMFPKGLPIGIVESAKNDAFNISKKIVVKPLQSLNKLERVLVIKNFNKDS
jgi:rod shape-determining protein MreC